ncbi:MAG: serine/threonine-protein kinase [Polyangiales bacterium]
MSTPQQHPLIGQVIAERYQVVELLAEGGMGAVYIAEHLTLHKEVALKVVHPEHAGNEELIARFAREAMATSRIDHPNVISAMDFGKLPDGTAYLAVQLVRGPSLTRVLKAERKLAWPRAWGVGAQFADALDAAHGHHIIHRDLKPDNVLLQYRDDGSEVVKVLDFGVAKFAPESKVPLVARRDVTQVGMVVGTPGYMAPEQTIGNPADERSDLYALGVILWEALMGEPLWIAEDLQGLVEKQMSETPRAVREVDAEIPEDFEALVAALLSRRAEERPSSAAQVRDVLRAFAAQGAVTADFERPRWRTGERPVPTKVRAPTSDRPPAPKSTPPPRIAQVDESAPTMIVDEMHLPEPPRMHTPTPTPMRRPTVPPPPPPTLPTYRVPPPSSPSSRMAWLLSALLATILFAVGMAFASGYFGLRDRAPSTLPTPASPASTEARAEPPPRAAEAPASARTERAPAKVGEAKQAAPSKPPSEALGPGDVPRTNDAADALADKLAVDTDEPALARTRAQKAAYLVHLQKLQRFKTCEGKRTQIEALGELGDPRAVPMLKRLLGRPRTGCGKSRREDCFGCLRKPLETALTKLGARPK